MLDTHSDAQNGLDMNIGLSPEHRIETAVGPPEYLTHG